MFETNGPIDAVITWVDGTAQDQRRQRQYYQGQAEQPLHENAVNPHRWACNDEILYCLKSIQNHAPWVRHVWIVTAGEHPDLAGLSNAITSKIKYVRHEDIFAGFTDALPTFNSLAIESLIWRIGALSERFLYFNDDVFLTGPLMQRDVFKGLLPVLRGRWVNHAALLHQPEARADPARFNHFMQINAAGLVGFEADNIFCAAHVVHPMRRSKMEQLFAHHRDDFRNNIRHRFRDITQFLPQGLHNHRCIADQEAIITTSNDHLHIRSGQGNDRPVCETLTVLQHALDADIKFLCINDLPQLEQIIPDARRWIEQAIAPAAPPV